MTITDPSWNFNLLQERLRWRYDKDRLLNFYDKIRLADSFLVPVSSIDKIKEDLRYCLDYRGDQVGPEWHTIMDELRAIIYYKCKNEMDDYGEVICVGRDETPEWLAVITYKGIEGHLDYVYVTSI